MKLLKGNILGIILFLVLTLFASPTQAGPSLNVIPDVNIGLLYPQTGSLSYLATDFLNAANLAIADLNNQQVEYNFLLMTADTASDGATTQTAANTLKSQNVVGIAGPASSASVMALESFAASNTIPIVSYSATNPTIQHLNDNGYIMSIAAPEDTQANATAKLLNLIGYDEIVILWDDGSTWNQDMKDHMVQEFSGPSTVYSYNTLTNAANLVSSFPSTADVLYVTGFDDQPVIEAVFAEITSQNVNIDVFGDAIVKGAYDASPQNVKDYLDGSFYMEYRSRYDSTFITDYINTYAVDPTNQNFTGEVYDAVKLIGEAYVNVDQGGAPLRDAILATSGTRVSGYIDFDQYGSLSMVRWPYYQVRQNTWTFKGWWDYAGFVFVDNIEIPYNEQTTTVTSVVTETTEATNTTTSTITSTFVETSTSVGEELTTIFTTVTNVKSEVSLGGASFFFSSILFLLIGIQRRNMMKPRKS